MTENNSCKIGVSGIFKISIYDNSPLLKNYFYYNNKVFSFVMLGLVDADYGFLLVDIGANFSTEDVPIQDTNPVSLPHNERNEI